jgi:hypothetical protein
LGIRSEVLPIRRKAVCSPRWGGEEVAEHAGIVREYKKQFKLDEAKLQKLVAVLTEHGKKLRSDTYTSFVVELKNSSYFETKKLDDVFVEHNGHTRKYKSVTAYLSYDASEAKKETVLAKVRFDVERDDHVQLVVRGEDRSWCFVLADELDAQIARTQISSRFLDIATSRRVDIAAFFFVMVSAAGVLASLFAPAATLPPATYRLSVDDKLNSLLDATTTRNLFVYWSVPFIVISIAAGILLAELHPLAVIFSSLRRSSFYWGDEIEEFDKHEKFISNVKWGIVVAFIVSVVAGVLLIPVQSYCTPK